MVDSHDKLTDSPIKTSVEDEFIETVGLAIESIVFGLLEPPPHAEIIKKVKKTYIFLFIKIVHKSSLILGV